MSSISSEPKESNDIDCWDIPFCEIENRIQTTSKKIEHSKTIIELSDLFSWRAVGYSRGIGFSFLTVETSKEIKLAYRHKKNVILLCLQCEHPGIMT